MKPPKSELHVPHLTQPLPIDGDAQKWRLAGIRPLAIIGPPTTYADQTDAADLSGLVRMAYEGSDLYVQVIQFDNEVSFYQDAAGHYMQDGCELAINGYFLTDGAKFDCTRTTEDGDALYIAGTPNGHFVTAPVPPTQCPRSIKVYEHAKDFPESAVIEAVYGADLRRSKALVEEFKIPITAQTYKLVPTATLFPMKPGTTFYVGISLNDCDDLGANDQRMEVFPVTYATFFNKYCGALAKLE